MAFLLSGVLLVLNACPGLPPSSGGILPAAPPDPSPVAGAGADKADSLLEALELSGRVIAESLDSGASIAVISITAPDSFEGDYALEELTLLLVRTRKFRVVERRNLDAIRAEQQFQLSGEVDDETAVSIGHLIGAAFVITGGISRGISQWESSKRLRLRVLDVQTGQIWAMTSVSYGGDL
jgi:TolB-like protein